MIHDLTINDLRLVLGEFRRTLGEIYGPQLRNVILYGSWARGDPTGDSDVDVAIVLEGPVTPGREIDRVIDVLMHVHEEHGILISVYPVSEDDYKSRQSPLLLNVRKDGVEV